MSSVAGCSTGLADRSNGVMGEAVMGDDGDSTGSRGNALLLRGEFENRTVLVDMPLGLNRPAVAGLPIRGLESLWFDRLGPTSMDDCEFPMMALGVGSWRDGRLGVDYYADIETSMPQGRPVVSSR